MPIIKPGETLQIEIERETTDTPAAPVAAPPKGIIRTRQPDDYLPRRITGGAINFYDVWQIKNEAGAYLDRDFAISTPLADPYSIVVEAPNPADFALFHAKLFEVEMSRWKDRYRRLDYAAADKYDVGLRLNDSPEIPLNSSNPKWTAGGLNFDPVTRISSESYGAFLHFDTNDAINFKITETPDYAADAISMTLAKKIDVFLIPVLASQRATSNTLSFQKTIYYNYVGFSRTRLLNRNFFRREWTNPDSSNANIAEINDWINYFKTAPESRAYQDNLADPSQPVSVISPFDVPTVTASSEFSGVGLFIEGASFAASLLAAVIQSGGRTFYVWTNTSSAGSYAKTFLYTKPSP